MKKLLTISLVALVLLTGCSSANTTNVSNPDEVVVDFGNKQITKGELYNMMLLNTPVTSVEIMLKKMLFEQEVPLTEEEIEEVRQNIEELKQMYSVYGEDFFLQLINSYGYETEEDYFQDALLSFQQNKLAKKYVTEKFDDMVTKFYPSKVQIIEVSDTLEVANEVLTAIKNGTSFEDAVAERTTASYSGAEQVITSNFSTSLPINLFNAVSELGGPGLIQEPILNESTGKYYIVNVVQNNPADMQEDIVTYLAGQDTISKESLAFYIKKNNFKIYDFNVYEAFKSEKPEYLD